MDAPTSAAARRRKQLATIHIRAKELGYDREQYEDMLWTVARVRSAGGLDEFGRARVLDHLKEILLSSGPGGGDRPTRSRQFGSAGRDRGPLLHKIKAMLDVRDRPIEYADGIAKQMFSIERVEWCKPDQLRKIVAALAYDQRRHEERRAKEP